MDKVLGRLDGKKTIISSILIFLAGGARALGYIDEQTFQIVLAFAGAIAVYGLRDAIKKIK